MARLIEETLREVRIEGLDLPRVTPVPPTTHLREVYRLLEEEKRGAVVVCEEGQVVGIFTERDVVYRTAGEAIDPECPISELMTRDPKCLRADQRLAEAIAMMLEGGYRHVPIVDTGENEIGLLGSTDIVKFIADKVSAQVVNLPPNLDQQMTRPEGG